MKEFKCAVLVPDCWASFQGQTDDEVLRQVTAHAREEHGMDEVPPEIVDKVRAAITER